MKFCSTLILAAGFLAVVSAANPSGCLNEVVEGTDYFEDKVEPVESVQWSIEYNNTYKIVTNIAANETYLLYQCGTNPPTDQLDGRHATVVPIPFTAAGIVYTTMVPFLELLGLRNKISTYLGNTKYVSSPCLRELIDDENVIEVLNTSNETNYEGVPEDLPAFIGNSGNVLLENSIRISVTEEITNLAVYEWIKYYSVFFNLEDKANEIFEETQSQYECVESNAGIIETDMQNEPVVLWGSYSNYCDQGWSVASCPEYYCEFATACSATMLSSKEGSIKSDKCGGNYMTTEEFVAFGKDADVWIYPGGDANDVLAQFEEELKDFVSVKNKKVYDTSASGISSWFEYRLAEPRKL
jgi:iron complex transport system substrate-binding protein